MSAEFERVGRRCVANIRALKTNQLDAAEPWEVLMAIQAGEGELKRIAKKVYEVDPTRSAQMLASYFTDCTDVKEYRGACPGCDKYKDLTLQLLHYVKKRVLPNGYMHQLRHAIIAGP